MTKHTFPDWYWLNEPSQAFLRNGYVPEDVDIKDHFQLMANKLEKILKRPGYAERFMFHVTKGHYLLATPNITNFLDERLSAISCFGSYVGDSVSDLLFTDAEIGMMSKTGGGTSAYVGDVRPKGSPISGGGFADGPDRFTLRLQDTTGWINQSNRRGKVAVYQDVRHKDINTHLSIMDRTSPIQEVPFAVAIDDEWMREMIEGKAEFRDIWAKIIKKKFEKGYPYLFWKDAANRAAPEIYGMTYREIHNTNLCTEIMLSNSIRESFVCCIAAMNLVHFDEWKDTDAIEILVYALDAFLEDFISKNEDEILMQRAVNFAKNQRAIGVGFSGWHSYLQRNMIAIESFEAKMKNVTIFQLLQKQTLAASIKMAQEYGRAPIFDGTDIERRHVTLMAGAPNTSSGFIFGQWTQSIEPEYSNYYIKAVAKMKYTQRNYFLTLLLKEKGFDTDEVWSSILQKNGSVQHLEFLDEHEKAVFKTFIEISPMELLIQQSQRQKYVDQGISFNTMIPFGTPAKDVSDYYIKAWELGLKSNYYQLNQNAAQVFTRSIMSCEACAG